MQPLDSTGVDLGGQVAIVTGGGRGLGRAIALALASAGARVAVVARSEAQLAETVAAIQGAGSQALAFPVDVTDRQAVETLVHTVERDLGPVDLLVNSAGLTGVPGPLWEADPDDWQRTLDVNVYGAFLCSATVLKGMVARQRGRIISLASTAGLVPLMYGSGYVVSKTALLRLTECIATDGQAHGIVAFALDPGSVRTAMTEYLIESEAGRTYLPWYREYILGGGDVPADLAAALAVLLASGRADALSGRFIQVSDDVARLIQQAGQIVEDQLYTLRMHELPSDDGA